MERHQLKELIQSDLYRLEGNIDKKLMIKNLLLSPSFKFIFYHRKCNYHRNKNRLRYVFYRILLYRCNIKYGFEISNSAQIGYGFYIGHRGAIIINPKAKIGSNFSITSGVTIGQENRGSRKGVPSIGNCVWIGANATLVGKIKIGNNVLIAPGAFVNFDVPDNSVVIGNPGVIKENNQATKGYITWEVKI
ncbi:MAG: serine acetyltransferase [Clostridium sp.]|uniref:serine O-acetyltransferase n=1 Tax=Clostridium sp. TaxID=1506 RepID=UPI002FCA8D6A